MTPGTSSVSPFSFTYTPVASDRGKIITITVTSNNPLGSPCSAAVVTYALTVNPIPSAPSIGTITNLTCTVITGSVVLNGFTLHRNMVTHYGAGRSHYQWYRDKHNRFRT